MLKLNFRNTDSMIIGEENGLNLSLEFEKLQRNNFQYNKKFKPEKR